MRFGSHSHEVHPEKKKSDVNVQAERARIVAMLRDIADRIERAPADRASEVLVWVRTAVEPLLAMLGRVLGPK